MQEYDLTLPAAAYLDAGLPVIALSGKAPNTTFHQTWSLDTAIKGQVETDEDRALLAQVFTHPSTTGIGLPIPEHLVVVDIDGEEGAVQWRELVGDDELIPETPVAKTGRGLHLWFISPKVRRNAKLGPKLDLKGTGGYVAAPPSLHPDGHRYQWLVPLVNEHGVIGPVAWLPDAIERLLDVRDQIAADDDVVRPVYTLYQLSLHNGEFTLKTELCPPPIDGLIRAVREAPEGNRNNILVWAALQARDEGVKLEDALRDLGAAAAEAGLDARETRTTIKSAYRRSPRV